MEHHVARKIILDGAGTQFDPEIVRALRAREAEFEAIRLTHQEQPSVARAA